MPSPFQTYFASAGAQILAHHGVAVTYVDGNSEETPITAVLGEESREEVETQAGRILQRVIPVQVSAADVTAPRVGHKIVIDSVTWSIHHPISTNAGIVHFPIVRPERISAGAQRLS